MGNNTLNQMAKGDHHAAPSTGVPAVGGVHFAPGFNVGSNAHLNIGNVSQNGTLVANGITANNNQVQVNSTTGTQTYQVTPANSTAAAGQHVGGIQFSPNFKVGSNANLHIGAVTNDGVKVANSVDAVNGQLSVTP